MSPRAGLAFSLVSIALCVAPPTFAQRSNKESGLAFDVASIRPSGQLTRDALAQSILSRIPRADPGGRWIVTRATLLEILGSLYPDYPFDRIVGGPAWVKSQRFDIEARTAPGTPSERMMFMARRLLTDRFKLRLGSAVRSVEVYALVITRDDRKLGPGVGPKVECDPKPEFGPNGPIPGLRPACRLVMTKTAEGRVRLSAGSAAISDLIAWIQSRAGRPVVDRTGLTGEFALRFDVPATVQLTPTPVGQASLPPLSADIFTAVREQLGMSLVPRREPMNFLTIEHVEMPTPN